MKRIIISIMIFCTFSIYCKSQIIEVYETSNDPIEKIDLNSVPIVDINSKLMINLNTDKLILEGSKVTQVNLELISKMETLNDLLFNQTKILEILDGNLKNPTESDKLKELGNYSVLMDQFYKKLMDNSKLERFVNNLIYEYFTKQNINKNIYPNPQKYVLLNLNKQSDGLMDEIKTSKELGSMYVQLIAVINTKDNFHKRVHIENFDTFDNGEFYELKRWTTSFSEEDIQTFNTTQQLANNLNSLVNNNFNGLKDLLLSNFESINSFQNLLDSLNNLQSNKEEIFSANIIIATNYLDEIKSEVLSIYELILKLTGKKDGDLNLNVLELYNSISSEVIKEIELFPNKMKELYNGLPNQFRNENSSIKNVVALIDECKIKLETDIKKIKEFVNYTSQMLSPVKETVERSKKFSGEVLSYSINNTPKNGYINLKTTGKRENGSELVIKVRVKTLKENLEQSPGRVLELKTIKLQQVNLYSISNVTLIAAYPYNPSSKVLLDNDFQFAPAGSLLFKFGSRKLNTWNTLSPGFGFNISSPDFDTDGVPEVGLGIVVTILRDVISLGWSYNLGTDDPFVFFGLSLPFSAPGLPINSSKSNISY